VARSFAAGSAGARRPGTGRAAAGPVKPSARFGPRLDGQTDPQRRPFKKSGTGASAEKKSFSKPWNEDRKERPAAKADGFTKFRKAAPEDREPLKPREQAGLPIEQRTAPKSSFDYASKPAGVAKRPYGSSTAEGGERGTFKPRSYERPGGGRESKPGGFAAKRPYATRTAEGGAKPFVKRPYTPRTSDAGEKPFAKRPFAPRTNDGGERSFAKRPYTPRTTEGGERPSYKPRSFEGRDRGAKPGGFGAKRPYTPRADQSGATPFAKRPYTPRTTEGGARPFAKRAYTPRPSDGSATESSVERTLPKRPYKPRAADAHERPFTKEPWVPKAPNEGVKRPYKSRGDGNSSRSGSGPRKSFGGKPGARSGGKPAGFGPKRSGTSGNARPATRKKPETGE
jgi:hypothetical protein